MIPDSLSFTTTPREEWSYIILTLGELFSIIVEKMWKKLLKNKWLKKHNSVKASENDECL